jgi:hypothetical protein
MVINDNATSFSGDMQKNCEKGTLVLSCLSMGLDKTDQHHTYDEI